MYRTPPTQYSTPTIVCKCTIELCEERDGREHFEIDRERIIAYNQRFEQLNNRNNVECNCGQVTNVSSFLVTENYKPIALI